MVSDLVIVALAGWQLTEAWHHGLLFRERRKWGRTQQEPLLDPNKPLPRLLGSPKAYLGYVMNCPFCLSHWMCLAVAFCWFAFGRMESGWLFQWPIIAMAATRLAQLGNDLFHDFSRSPNSDEPEELVVNENLEAEEQ